MLYPEQSAYVESEILNASPERLVNLLYGLAKKSLVAARQCNQAKDISGRGYYVNKVFAVLVELQNGLDFEQGKEIAENYARLYDYCQRRLLEAHAQQSDAIFAEVQSLVEELTEAWQVVVAKSAAALHSSPIPLRSEHVAGSLDCVG